MADRWVILSKEECKWCKKVKELLHENDIEFQNFDVNEKLELREFLIASGLTTVPQVYMNGFHIGTYEETKDYLRMVDA